MIKCQKEKLKKKQELCNQQHSMHNGISVEEKSMPDHYTSHTEENQWAKVEKQTYSIE